MTTEHTLVRHLRDLADELRHDPEVRGALLAAAQQSDRLLARLGTAEASAVEWRARYEDLARQVAAHAHP